MQKRLLAAFLALCMMMTLTPFAFAADENAGSNTNEPQMAIGGGDSQNNTVSNNNDAEEVEETVAKIGEQGYASLSAAITAAESGNTIELMTGEYILPTNVTYANKVLTIKAAEGATVSFDMGTAKALHDANITFENLTFDYKTKTKNDYIGLQHASKLTYKNCTINGKVFLYASEETFTDCTFNQTAVDYNVWTYGAASVIFNHCTFKCAGKSVLLYNEGTNTKTDLQVTNCTFTASAPVDGKAAIEIDTHLMSGASTITIDNATTVTGFGTGSKSGNSLWNDKAQTVETNKNVTVTVGGEVVYKPAPAIQVNGVAYDTLEAAFAAMDAEHHTLTLNDQSVWDASTPVYWQSGTQSGYVANLTSALTAAYQANSDDILIVCRPDADVGTMTHGHVADNLTIYGNNAYVSNGECDLEVDTYTYSRETGKQVKSDGTYLDKNITITAYELDNLGVWGQRNTNHTININLNDCDGKVIEGTNNPQRVYLSNPVGTNNITLTDCNFITKTTAVYSNADGKVVIDDCSFNGSQVPVNFNHKANGDQTVTVKNSTFTNCGDTSDWAAFSAPIRFVNSANGTQETTVENCSFTGTVGSNGDILLGDGRSGEKSNNMSITVKNTEATVRAQKPGYYKDGVVANQQNQAEKATTASEVFESSINKMFAVAQVGDEVYASLNDAVNAAQSGDTVTLLKDTNSGFTVPAGKTIIFDLHGNKIERARQAIQNNGTLTICDSAKTGAIISTGSQAIGVGYDSTTTIDYASVSSVEGAVITGYATGATITIKDGVFSASDNAVIAGNGNATNASGTSRVNANTITILGGTFNGGTTSEGYVACGIYAPWKDNVTVEGGTFNITGGAGIVARAGNVTIKGGEFNTTGNAIGKVGDSRVVVPCSALVFDSEAEYPALTADSKITVEGGKFKSQVDAIAVVKKDTDNSDRIVISNGYFSSDPSDYCVAKKTGIPSTEPGYAFTVGEYTAPDVKPATGEPAITDNLPDTVDQTVKTAVTDAAKTVKDEKGVLSAAAKQEATKIGDDQKTQAIEEIKKDTNVSTPDGTAIHVYAQTYLAIEPTKVDVGTDGATVTSITLDIQPMSRVVAATVDLSQPNTELKTEGQGQNAVILPGSEKPINIQTMTISITLPSGFAGDATKVYVQHKGYEYEASVTTDAQGNKVATFTNPHGFSEFTISKTSIAEAKIGDTSYMKFQDAVDAAQDGDVITVTKGGLSATMSGSSRTITVKNGTAQEIKVKVNGDEQTLAAGATHAFTYTRPSSGGSGGSGVTNYLSLIHI